MTGLSLPPSLAEAFLAEPSGTACRIQAGRCRRTGRYFFPAPVSCPCCMEPPEIVALPGRGRVHAFTVVRTKAPFALPEPYAVGYVDLDTVPLRVFGLFAPDGLNQLRIDLEVALVVAPLGVDSLGEPCLRPVFQAAGGALG